MLNLVAAPNYYVFPRVRFCILFDKLVEKLHHAILEYDAAWVSVYSDGLSQGEGGGAQIQGDPPPRKASGKIKINRFLLLRRR